MLNQNEEKTMNETLDKLEKAAISGQSTDLLKQEIIKLIKQQTQLKYKLAYNKGYRAGTQSKAKDDWQYDPGDSRG